MEIKKYLMAALSFLAVVSIFSCKKTTDDADIASQPVVVGYIMVGHPISVKVYQQKALDDTATYGALIPGLKLSVSDGTKSDALVESATGTYTSVDSTFLVTGKTYTLNFTYNGQPVSASTLMPSKATGFTSSATTLTLPTANTLSTTIALIFKWNNADSLNHILVFKNDEIAPPLARIGGRGPVNFTFNVNKATYYNVYYSSLNYLDTYRAILFTVNQEYINVLNNATSATSKNLQNPPTNVIGGLGIFTAMQADTIKLTFY